MCDKKEENIILKNIDKLNSLLQNQNIQEMMYLLGSKKEIIQRNFLAGIFRGIGIGIGVTIITAILLILLRKIVTLNIPVIGEYISDIVEIVEKNGKTY